METILPFLNKLKFVAESVHNNFCFLLYEFSKLGHFYSVETFFLLSFVDNSMYFGVASYKHSLQNNIRLLVHERGAARG